MRIKRKGKCISLYSNKKQYGNVSLRFSASLEMEEKRRQLRKESVL